MSRRPTSTTSGMRQPSAVSRTASSASLAMPPPNRIPSSSGRPVSSASSAGANGDGHGQEVAGGSRQTSPKKGRKTVGPSGGGGNAGEINIQVVVRLRSVLMESSLSKTDGS
jgi:kinesin family protein 11